MKRSKKLSVKAVREEEVKLRGGGIGSLTVTLPQSGYHMPHEIFSVFNQLYEAVTVK